MLREEDIESIVLVWYDTRGSGDGWIGRSLRSMLKPLTEQSVVMAKRGDDNSNQALRSPDKLAPPDDDPRLPCRVLSCLGKSQIPVAASARRHPQRGPGQLLVDPRLLQRKGRVLARAARARETLPVVPPHAGAAFWVRARQPAAQLALFQLGAHPAEGLDEEVLAGGYRRGVVVAGLVRHDEGGRGEDAAALFAAELPVRRGGRRRGRRV